MSAASSNECKLEEPEFRKLPPVTSSWIKLHTHVRKAKDNNPEFNKAHERKLFCNYCAKIMNWQAGEGTGNEGRHIRENHPAEYEKAKSKYKDGSTPGSHDDSKSKKQLTISQAHQPKTYSQEQQDIA